MVIEVTRNVPVWTWDVKGEAFGNTAPDQNPDGDANAFVFDMRFPGQRFDAVSGLNQNYFRDYEPGTGRYTTSDPTGLSANISLYQFVSSQPLTRFDPDGLEEVNINLYNKGTIIGNFNTRRGSYGVAPGVTVSLKFTPGEACQECTQIRWIQTITTNAPRIGATSPYLDPFPNTDDLPFYEKDYEYSLYPNQFYDSPGRSARPSGAVNWSARLCLVCVGQGSKIIKEIKCIRYGFTVTPSGKVIGSSPKIIPTPKR